MQATRCQCACLLWCLGQVAAVESVKTGKGLTGHKLALWNSVKSSSWLTDETVGSFLGLPGREARRDLLHEASRLADGTYALLPVGAQLLADALVTLLSSGALSLWERGLGRVSSGSGSRALSAVVPPLSARHGAVCSATYGRLGRAHPFACDACAFASHLRSGAHVECPGAVVAHL